MDRTAVTTRRADRIANRATRPPVLVEVTTAEGEVKLRRQKLRRPSRHTANTAAIAESWAATA